MNPVFRHAAHLMGALILGTGLLPAPGITQTKPAQTSPAAATARTSATASGQPASRPASRPGQRPDAARTGAPKAGAVKASARKTPTRGPVPAQALPALKRPSAEVLPLDEPAEDASDVSLVMQTLRSGCAPAEKALADVLAGVQVQDPQWLAWVEQTRREHPDLLQASPHTCLPFTLSLGDRGQVTSMAWLRRGGDANNAQLVSLTRPIQGEQLDLKIEQLPPSLIDHRKVDVALDQILGERGRGLAGALPAALERQVYALARAFQERHQLSPGSLVRIVYTDGTDAPHLALTPASAGDRSARLLGMRFFDARQVVDFGSAIWIDREDLPGGFFTTAGVNAERMFWSSPIDHVRISRGVGSFAYARTVRKTVRAGDQNVRVSQRVTGWKHHQGVDFSAPTGTPVHAVADGRVLMAAFYGGYGNLIILEHAGGYTTYYAHLSAYASGLQAGSQVRRGEEIGRVGSTGRSTGPHLHFEIRKDNVYIDPLAPHRTLDLWALRDSDRPALARRNVLVSAITDRPADAPAQASAEPQAPDAAQSPTAGEAVLTSAR